MTSSVGRHMRGGACEGRGLCSEDTNAGENYFPCAFGLDVGFCDKWSSSDAGVIASNGLADLCIGSS